MSILSRSKFAVRLILSLSVRVYCRILSSNYDDQRKHLIIFAPHQDDEALGCTGLIIVNKQIQNTVSIVYITDGSSSHSSFADIDPLFLASQRKEEARKAMAKIGVESRDLAFLDSKDGGLARISGQARDDLIRSVRDIFEKQKPTEIALPCHADGSSEHDAAYLIVKEAVNQCGLNIRVLEFPVWSWWNPLLVFSTMVQSKRIIRVDVPNLKQIKREVLSTYVSQTHVIGSSTKPVLSKDFINFFISDYEFFFDNN